MDLFDFFALGADHVVMVVLSAVFVAGRPITEVTAANNPGGLEGEEAGAALAAHKTSVERQVAALYSGTDKKVFRA